MRRAAARTHHAQTRQRAGGLVVAEFITKFAVKHLQRLERVPLLLLLGHRAAWATAAFAAGGVGHLEVGGVVRREQRVAHARGVGVIDFAVLDFRHALEATEHHLHIRLHDLRAKAAELLLVRLVHDVVIFFLGNIVVLQKTRHLEKAAEERVTLHAQMKVRAVGGALGDVKPRQNKHANVVLLHELPMLGRDALPRLLGRFVAFPDKTRTLVQSLERVAVRERLRVAAQHDVDVVQLAVHLNEVGRDGEKIIRR